jgi:hypothetical protein
MQDLPTTRNGIMPPSDGALDEGEFNPVS